MKKREFYQKSQKGSIDIGKCIGFLISLIILGFIGYGISQLIKSWGEAGEEYGKVLIKTKRKSMTLNCQNNLRVIWKDLQIYEIENDSFPSSLEELAEWAGSSKLIYCPEPNGQEYSYIPGQNMNMSPENVLAYESEPAHDECCNILRLNGQIELLSPEQVQIAVSETLDRLKR